MTWVAMKRRAPASLAVVCLLIIGLAWWGSRRRALAPRATDLQASFVAFTNTSAGAAAVFLLTNATSLPHHFQITFVEHQATGGWESENPTLKQALVGMLDPGQGFYWPVPVPVEETNMAWRIRLSCTEAAVGVPGLVDRGREVVARAKTGNPTHIFTGRMYEILSTESR
jgi:hypothetical protein